MLFWISLLALVTIAYTLLITWAFPKLLLKINYPIAHTNDRGLKKYKFSDSDYAAVYEPSLATRKYITQYILAKKDGKKTFKGKIAPNISYIDFDIALFNAQEKCFHIINSMDIVGNDGVTDEIELPRETAYASVTVNQVNNKQMRKAQVTKVTKKRLFGFATLSLIASVIMSVFSMLAFSNIFGGLFRETFAKAMLLSGWIFIFPPIICAVCIIGACCMLCSRNSKR